jgi:hypothetical protein
MRARFYDTWLARFLSRDPIGDWGDSANHGNAYAYAGGDPVNRVDRDGRIGVFIGGFGSGSIGGGLQNGNAGMGYVENPPSDERGEAISEISGVAGELHAASWSRGGHKAIVKMIQDALRADPCQPVILAGHSLGAHRAVMVAKSLAKLGICVDLLALVDFNPGIRAGRTKRWDKATRRSVEITACWMSKPKNVVAAHHLHTPSGARGLGHVKPEGYVNHAVEGTTHGTIDNDSGTWNILRELVSGLDPKGCNCPPESTPPTPERRAYVPPELAAAACGTDRTEDAR